MRKPCLFCLMAALALVGTALPARAQSTWYVATTGSDANNGTGSWAQALATISNAIVRSSASDTILVSNGTYGVTTDILVNKDVKILGQNRDTTIVQRTGGQTNRIFYISSAGALVANLTVTGGLLTNLTSGGGIYMVNGTVSNCLIAGNAALNCQKTAWGGGGVCMETGTVQGCVIRGNQSTDYPATTAFTNFSTFGGGGVYMQNGTLRDSTIENNTNLLNGYTGGWAGGGGIFFNNGIITNCIVQGNYLQTGAGNGPGGGGIAAHNIGTIANCDILNNYSGRRGGGIYMQASAVRILRCRIIGNQCPPSGNTGGAGLAFNSGGVMENCLIATNIGASGIIMAYPSSATIRNCTIVGHNIGIEGWSIYNSTKIENCIVNNNVINFNHISSQEAGATLWSITTNSCSTSFTNVYNNNVTNAPQFVNFANGDYRLGSASPCINAGTNQSWMTNAVDLDGTRRVDVFLPPIVDMGAYEFHPSGMMFSGR